ncbi:MAG: helix-hairpin-helix domain-containing protein [Algoriphagus sp.]|nr:helix-hairpin-helix domain-containing protein [Algoriphagus sp.]
MKQIFNLVLLLLFSLPTIGQDRTPNPLDIQQLVERLFPVQEEEVDYDALFELLTELYQNPLDINRVTGEELAGTYLLSPPQIQSFLDHRSQSGEFLSLYELQSLPHWDATTLDIVLPFLTLETEKSSPKSFLDRLRSEENRHLLFRHRRTLELRRGYQIDPTLNPTHRYLGDQNDLLLRFRIQHAKDFSLGFLLEKDAGEVLAWDPKTSRYGFNFASFHHTRYNLGKWKTLSLGDFQASFGQGLVFGAGFSLGKGAETVPTVKRSTLGILPYTSSLESGFFRGMGITRQLGSWQSTLLFSSIGKDGRLATQSDTLGNPSPELTSLSQSGLHRSQSELSTKNQLHETNLGTNIQFQAKSGKWSAGINALHTQFSIPWNRTPNRYNQFEFSGRSNTVGSMYVNLLWKNFSFFGESARSSSQGQGTVVGFISSLSKTVDFSLFWRRYDRDFHSFYATAFAESTRPINEQGTYLGIQIKPSSTVKLNAYLDYFRFPWLKFRMYAPSLGQEWLARLSYQPQKNLLASVQVKQERKMRNSTTKESTSPTYTLLPISKNQVQATLELEVSPEFSFQSRILWNQVILNQANTQGWMLIQDISFKQEKWKLIARMALFDTETFDNRLYTYEHNALGTFAIPAFSGKGSRKYLLVQYRIHPKLTGYLRIAQSRYADRDLISSGMQEITGPKQTETVLVLRYSL